MIPMSVGHSDEISGKLLCFGWGQGIAGEIRVDEQTVPSILQQKTGMA